MPLGLFAAALGVSVLLTTASGYYLLINARSVAALFNTPTNDLAPGPAGRRVPRQRLFLAMALFAAGFAASLLIWSFAGTDPVSQSVESRPEEVQRP